MDKDIRFLVDNRLSPPKKFYNWAFSTFPIYTWKNKLKEIRSSERTVVPGINEHIKKRLTVKTRLDFYSQSNYFVWVGATSKRIEIQTYKVSQSIVEGKEEFSIQLYNMEHLSEEFGHVKVTKDYENQYRYGMSVLGVYQTAYSTAYFYQDHHQIVSKLTNSPLKYLDMVSIKDLTGFDVIMKLPHIFKYRNLIEYAQKQKMHGIVKEIIGGVRYFSYYGSGSGFHGDMRKLTFGYLRKNKMFFKNTQRNSEFLKFYEAVVEIAGRYVDGFENYFKITDLETIPENVKPVRFMNWVVKNKVRATDYRDYRRFIEEVNVAFTGDRIVLPKNFRQAHDEAAANHEVVMDKMVREEYERRLEEALLKAETIIDKYAFIAPKKLDDLKEEGKNLRHCVGSYTKKQASGETSIFFVRNKENIDNPLYTLELHNKRIEQIRGQGNANAPEDVWEEARSFMARADKLGISY